jgi:antitoxin component YwqK of YwqJK toxin-antitoxin module
MRSLLLLSVLAILLSSCGGSGTSSSGASIDLSGYETEKLSGSDVIKAFKKDGTGDIIEEGYVVNGKKNGVWMTFWQNEMAGRIKTLASYSDGMLNGPYLEYSNRSQIEKQIYYSNNQYDGNFVTYKFGRKEKDISYKDNKLNGPSIEYNSKGDKQKEVHYKNGELHGAWRTYNEEGELTLEYEYKNGKKVSGGIIEK